MKPYMLLSDIFYCTRHGKSEAATPFIRLERKEKREPINYIDNIGAYALVPMVCVNKPLFPTAAVDVLV